MAKNDWDNRKLLAEKVVETYTAEELKESVIGSIMSHYSEYDDIFHADWTHHRMDDAVEEEREVRVLVVGDQSTRYLATVVKDLKDRNPDHDALKSIGEDDAEI